MIYIYNNKTGQIMQKVDCPDEHAEHYEREDHTVIISNQNVNVGTNYIDSGEFVSIQEKPSDYHKWDWAAKQWNLDIALAETDVRAKRDRLLASSDWTQLPDVPLTTKETWTAYRQQLRDITSQSGFPLSVTWPVMPI